MIDTGDRYRRVIQKEHIFTNTSHAHFKKKMSYRDDYISKMIDLTTYTSNIVQVCDMVRDNDERYR